MIKKLCTVAFIVPSLLEEQSLLVCLASNRSMEFSFACDGFLVFQVQPVFSQIDLKRSPGELSTSVTVVQSLIL